jgi:hypothetical protein
MPDTSATTRPGLKTPPLGKPPGLAAKPAGSSGGITNWVLIAGAVVLFVLGAFLIITALTSGAQSPARSESLNVPDEVAPHGATQAAITERALAGRRTSDLSASAPVSITVQTSEHVWARITVDGQTAFEGTLRPGTVQDWQAEDSVILETGNAAAVYVLYRGQIAPLGERGQIVARAWSQDGVSDVPLAQPEALPDGARAATHIAATAMP